jgi:hypothetical protein
MGWISNCHSCDSAHQFAIEKEGPRTVEEVTR